jgi:hypothetical protein
MSDKSQEQVIGGALFDFAGFLTTRDEAYTVGAAHDASRMVELLEEWAATRNLSLKGADVLGWNSALNTR